ncbi:MAG: hypothetical protein IPK76_18810 [Lewinellaceae bacterium]|nr:hypothetical protein [Lewinellaceae bacterium]
MAAILFAMLLVSIGATWWAVKQQRVAEDNSIEATKQQKLAEDNLNAKIVEETKKERLNFEKYNSSGDVFVSSGDFKLALRYYQMADSILLRFPQDSQLQSKKEVLMIKIIESQLKNASM